MRLLTAALLTFMLVAMCQGRSMRYPRQGASVTTFDNAIWEKSSEEGGNDDLSTDDDDDDPDWVPTDEDYDDDDYNDYKYNDEGFDRGTRQAKTAVLKPDFGATTLEDSDDDDVNDPDWVPTEEDYEYTYYDDNLEYDSDEDGDNDNDDDDGDSRNGDDPVDALWSSDDDPDWKPDEAGDDDDDDESAEKEDETARLEEVLFDIALLMVERGALNETGPDNVLAVLQTLKELDLTYEQAVYVLSTLETDGDTSENEIVTEVPRANVAAFIKSKRQLKSHRVSQATQDLNQDRVQAQPIQASGDIQDSLPNQYNAEDIDGVYDQGTWGNGQINQVGSVNQANQGNQQDIAVGVEPYYPQGVNPSEVGSGIEPLDRDSGSAGSSDSNWLVRGWGHVLDTADKVGDRVEDTFSDWGDKIAGVASGAVDSARDAAQSAGESIVNTYHKVKGKIPELLEKIRSLFTKFGVLVQTGAEYYIQQMEGAVDKVRQAEILDKLQQKLAEGNEQVTAFFQTLGEKASSWTHDHGHENVDAGLITIQQVHPDEGVVGEDIVQVGGQQTMPNWFQDEEVIEQLNQIMNSGILEQSDVDVLSQQKNQEAAAAAATQTGAQQQQNQQQNRQQQSPTSSPVIQIQSSGSRRSLRALIDALMVH